MTMESYRKLGFVILSMREGTYYDTIRRKNALVLFDGLKRFLNKITFYLCKQLSGSVNPVTSSSFGIFFTICHLEVKEKDIF